MLKRYSFILFLLLFIQTVFSQVIPMSALEKKSIFIGDQVTLTLTVKTPSTIKIKWPTIADSLIENMEVIKKNPIDTIKNSDNTITYKQVLVVTSFNAGAYTIPPFVFTINAKLLATAPLILTIKTISIDASKPIKDIKPPFDAPFSFMEALPYILILIVIIVVVLLVIRFIKNKNKDKPIFPLLKEKQTPPHEIALNALETLRQKKLWQQSKFKDYYTELTDILREYIEKRYGILAQEMISDEIISALQNSMIDAMLVAQISNTLTSADLVKFAKGQPLPEINQRAFDNIYSFINQTALHIKDEEVKGGADEVV